MSLPSKILWSEGLFLRPQHFQRQDLYHEARLQRMALTLHPYAWGVQDLAWDMGALKNGRLRLERLFAVFPDGDLLDAPDSDPLPPPVDLNALPAAVQEVGYVVGLPSLSADANNTAHEQGNTRYAQSNAPASDLFSGAAPADVAFLRKSARLLSDLEPLGAFTCIPLTRLRRTVAGGFEHDPAFVAPALSLAGAVRIKLLLEHLLDALQAKINALQGHMREPSRNIIEFRSGDVSSFWLLHTASFATATLTHYLRQPGLHPERLFEAMLGLAGALMTYSKSGQAGQLPAYVHGNPGPCFAQLDATIRDLLDTVISAKYFGIALVEQKSCYHFGKLDSEKVGQGTTLYLAIGASMPTLELVEVAPMRIKVGAPDDVEKCVLSAMPGVKLTYMPQVPAAIPVRPDTCYFALDSRGMLYEQMLKAQSICVYVPAGIRDLRLELIAVAA
jgi:type VI secretion system protein ImpJ